jgi:hypothetical protein
VKQLIILIWVLIPALTFAQPTREQTLAPAAPVTALNPIEFKYQNVFEANPYIPHAPLLRLLTYFEAHQETVTNKNYVTFVDFSLPTSERRMYVIDLRDGHGKKYLVAHGSGSDPEMTGRPYRFSNTEDSNMSSLGIYLTGIVVPPEDSPKHANSMYLYGLESTNDNAFTRHILLHGAWYVKPGMAPTGESQGCFVVEEHFLRRIDEQLQGGSLLMAWIEPSLIHR